MSQSKKPNARMICINNYWTLWQWCCGQCLVVLTHSFM